MFRASNTVKVVALFVFPLGCTGSAEGESCSLTTLKASQAPVLLQTAQKLGSRSTKPSVTDGTASADPGHKLLLLARQHANRSYVIPEKPRHVSQLQLNRNARGTSDLPQEMQDILEVHNFFRCLHNVPPMTWDPAIAANAQAWADAGRYEHSPDSARKLPNIGQVGENLAWGYPSRTGKDAVEAWYAEVSHTDGTPVDCKDKNADAGDEPICHYTQVVWESSTKLGCGKGKANVLNYEDGDFWVCQYGPAGNYEGQFTKNVLPPAKTAAQCSNPTPPLTEGPKDPDCKDGAVTDHPVITYHDGSKADCSSLQWACLLYPFVAGKCRETCNAC